MPRPRSKEDLLKASDENFTKLFILIDSMTEAEQEQTFAFEDRDKNVRDVLVHLYEWHKLLINWIESNHSGNKTNFLPEPYNWKTYPKMNIGFWEKHQHTSLKEAVTLFKKTHADATKLINTFSNEELFTKKYFDWTGTTDLGSYCVSATSSHYDWAIKKIKNHKKSLSENKK